MPIVNVYLTFNGNCEEAFQFYKSVFGGDFEYVGRWSEALQHDDIPGIPFEKRDKIMHITLPISKETMLMGNDSLGSVKISRDNFTLLVKADSKHNADTLFNNLSAGGTIVIPMKEVFWGSYYGMVTDKFGILWKITSDLITVHKT